MKQVILFSLLMASSTANISMAQTDFFWSFENFNAYNTDVSQDFEIGQKGSLFLFYSTIGPNETDINEAIFLDLATSKPGVIEFTDAAIFDFGVDIGGTPLGNRWDNGNGSAGSTGDVSSDFINELHAFNNGNGFGIDGANNCEVFCDSGWNSGAEAFLTGRVDFTVVGDGTVDILGEIGAGGLINDGAAVFTEFGAATITVGNSVPEPTSATIVLVLGLFASICRNRKTNQ